MELIGRKSDSETITLLFAKRVNGEVEVYKQIFYKSTRTYSDLIYNTSFCKYKGVSAMEMAKLHAEWGCGCTLIG